MLYDYGVYASWRVCDICGSEGMCRPADAVEISKYDAEDVCQRCDVSDHNHLEKEKMKSLLIRIRDSGQWFHSALEMEHDVDGEQLLKEIEAIVGEKP